MQIYKPQYTSNGKTLSCKRWYIAFTDDRQDPPKRLRLSAFTSKDVTNTAATNIDRLLKCGGDVSDDLHKWLENIPSKMRNKLSEFNLIPKRLMKINTPLTERLQEMCLDMENKKSPIYVKEVKATITAIINGCNFVTWGDVAAGELTNYLGNQKKSRNFGQRQYNKKLKSFKAFCRWIVAQRYATNNPIDDIEEIGQTEIRRQRRVLKYVDLVSFLDTVRNSQDMHHNLTGYERFLVYLLALQTGLRANEIRNLMVGDFNFDTNTVSLAGAFTKNKKKLRIPLKKETAAELKKYFCNKLDNVKAFAMPVQPAQMIKQDLKAAKIPYKVGTVPFREGEGYFDFHSLRHSFLTSLDDLGASSAIAQRAARHSSFQVTERYLHTDDDALRAVIDKQMDLTQPQKQVSQAG
ncbi:MAG: hypothetical protein A2Y12_05485 [Planctomycetes bacterium GWF2_42_9]|nr:MAG: hypothetical protein A2Y12_05485 [Planctomycetes bacterium GWF2_42_9]